MTEKESKYNTLYMDIARRVSDMSYAVRSKVGAVLVRDGNILGYGFNGTPAGEDNCCEYEHYDMVQRLDKPTEFVSQGLRTKDNVIHAEQNILFKCLREGKSTLGTSLYITLAPCLHCAKMIYGAGIKNVFYSDVYRESSGIFFLEKHNVEITKL
jgi:dCMP deaminase